MAFLPQRLILTTLAALTGTAAVPGIASAEAVMATGSFPDARLLFSVGSALGVMAFAIGTAIVCLRTTRRARETSEAALAEAQKLRLRKSRLEAILAAEPQMLFAWTDSPQLKVLIVNLPASLGVPSAPEQFLRFPDWLMPDDAEAMAAALEALTLRGEAFNLMLHTRTGKHVEIDGRAAGSAISLKVRDVVGQRLDLARMAERQRTAANEVGALKSLLDTLPKPAWLRDPDGRLIWVNRAYAAATEAGAPERAVAGQIELMSDRHREAAGRALAAGGRYQQRLDLPTGSGLRSHDAWITASHGFSAGIALDLEPSAPNLQDTAARLRSFDRMATAFAVFDARQHLVHFNQAYADLWQLDADWLASGPSDGEILDRLRLARRLPEKADYQDWKRAWLDAYGKDAQFDEEWHLPDGRTLHVLIDRTAGAGVTYLYENVTERLSLESRYNALIQVQRETLDTLREGVAVFSPDGTLRLYNRAFASIWRLSPRQLDGRPHIDEIINWCRVLYDNAEDWERTKGAVTDIVAERHPYENQFDRPDGSVIATAALPLPDGGTLLTYVDVSDSVRAERALKDKNEALEAADRMKSSFVGHVSYELRTPLNHILGFADMIAMPASGPLSPKQLEYLDHIRSSGDALRALINDILDLASIDAGVLKLDFTAVSVPNVIESLGSGLAERLKQAGVDLHVELGTGIDRLVADEQRLTQILYNLLSNAITFSAKGGVVTLSAARERGEMVRFTIKDEGAGIPPDYQTAVFDRFESRAQGEAQGGAGLGLAIAKHLVEMHGGSIGLKSSPEGGTEISVWLPLEQAEQRLPTPDSETFPDAAAG